MIIPCIDLLDRKVVQLVQGERKAIEQENYLDLAEYFARFGEFNVIDLNAAKGTGDNLGIIEEICRSTDRSRVGGGVRSVEAAELAIGYGAKKVIVGSAAYDSDRMNYRFLEQLRDRIGRDKIIIAIDSKGGRIAINGWKSTIAMTPFEAIKGLEEYCSEFLWTFVDKEGMMKGTDLETAGKLAKMTKNRISAAGGISSWDEILELEKLGVDSVVGMSIYTGKIKLEELG